VPLQGCELLFTGVRGAVAGYEHSDRLKLGPEESIEPGTQKVPPITDRLTRAATPRVFRAGKNGLPPFSDVDVGPRKRWITLVLVTPRAVRTCRSGKERPKPGEGI